eukprot:9308951-Lingulodinium_polyedra.AAC.1
MAMAMVTAFVPVLLMVIFRTRAWATDAASRARSPTTVHTLRFVDLLQGRAAGTAPLARSLRELLAPTKGAS